MKKLLPYLKNKFILASTIFFVYTLFLDENDVFTVISQTQKLKTLKKKQIEMENQLVETSAILAKLKYSTEVERFAREEKYFKKDDEDVFVIFYE